MPYLRAVRAERDSRNIINWYIIGLGRAWGVTPPPDTPAAAGKSQAALKQEYKDVFGEKWEQAWAERPKKDR